MIKPIKVSIHASHGSVVSGVSVGSARKPTYLAEPRVHMQGGLVWRVLVAIYLGALLSANAMAAKLVAVGPCAVTVGALAIPVVYSVTDLLNELYGKTATRRVVWMGFLSNLVLVLFSLLFSTVPAAGVGASQEAFATMFGITWRVVLGSQAAYLCSSMLDVQVFSQVRELTNDRHLWLRQSAAVGVSQLADSLIFTVIAFAGTLPIRLVAVMAMTEYATKISVSPLRTLISYAILARIRNAR